MKAQNMQPADTTCEACRHKATPRSEDQLRQLQNRLKRMMGQLGGISRMLDDNRYCGDILMQVAAVESALQAFGYLLLARSHGELRGGGDSAGKYPRDRGSRRTD